LRRRIELGRIAFGLIFIDAQKPSYVQAVEQGLRWSRPGSVIVAGNAGHPDDANAQGVKAFHGV
jgi:predicted O-methyltransferase YrrM